METKQPESERIRASKAYGTQPVMREKKRAATTLRSAPSSSGQIDPATVAGIRYSSPMSGPAVAYDASVSVNDQLPSAANGIGVRSDIYERLGLHDNPWVEVTGWDGRRLGAFALKIEGGETTVLLTQAMNDILSRDGTDLTQVKLRPVQWSRRGEEKSLSFDAARNLPGHYCEYWYSVGVSLDALNRVGLVPGAYAIVRGPDGYQSVRVQLVDRGQTDEIWLSQPVRESIGVQGEEDLIKLFPKT